MKIASRWRLISTNINFYSQQLSLTSKNTTTKHLMAEEILVLRDDPYRTDSRSATKHPRLVPGLQKYPRLFPEILHRARSWSKKYKKVYGADPRSTTKCPELIPRVQQHARDWSKCPGYNKVPGADPKSTSKCPRLILAGKKELWAFCFTYPCDKISRTGRKRKFK